MWYLQYGRNWTNRRVTIFSEMQSDANGDWFTLWKYDIIGTFKITCIAFNKTGKVNFYTFMIFRLLYLTEEEAMA